MKVEQFPTQTCRGFQRPPQKAMTSTTILYSESDCILYSTYTMCFDSCCLLFSAQPKLASLCPSSAFGENMRQARYGPVCHLDGRNCITGPVSSSWIQTTEEMITTFLPLAHLPKCPCHVSNINSSKNTQSTNPLATLV